MARRRDRVGASLRLRDAEALPGDSQLAAARRTRRRRDIERDGGTALAGVRTERDPFGIRFGGPRAQRARGPHIDPSGTSSLPEALGAFRQCEDALPGRLDDFGALRVEDDRASPVLRVRIGTGGHLHHSVPLPAAGCFEAEPAAFQLRGPLAFPRGGDSDTFRSTFWRDGGTSDT